MNYVFGFFVLIGCSLLMTFVLRKVVFVLDATGRRSIVPKNRYCEKRIYFRNAQRVEESIIGYLSTRHFSVRKREDGHVFFSSVFSPYPIRIQMLVDAENVQVVLSDAHCQMMISRHQMNKYSAKIERMEKIFGKLWGQES